MSDMEAGQIRGGERARGVKNKMSVRRIFRYGGDARAFCAKGPPNYRARPKAAMASFGKQQHDRKRRRAAWGVTS